MIDTSQLVTRKKESFNKQPEPRKSVGEDKEEDEKDG